MASSLLDSLTALAGPNVVNTVASRLGEPNEAVSKGLTASFGAILAGLLGKSSEGGTLQQILDMVKGSAGAARVTDNPIQLAEALPHDGQAATGGALSSIVGGGQQLLGSLFGGQSSTASNLIAQTSGLKPSSAASLLTFAAPLVLGVLNKKMSSGGLNAGNFANLLSSERDNILSAAPAGLGSLVGMAGAAREAAGRFTGATGAAMGTAAATTAGAVRSTKSGGNKWLLPILIILLLLGLLWYFSRRDKSTMVGQLDATADSMARMADSAGSKIGTAVDSAMSKLGAFVDRKLPDGTSLNVPENGVESQLLAFIADSSRMVNDTVWFNFDRLRFQTGSAMLETDSQEQLQNVANIMKAYPNVALKIGGYTDNTGNAAANLKLSKDRANTVQKSLVDMGIAANRLESEGYGDAHPVADNATEEGRAANRRIALRVTKK